MKKNLRRIIGLALFLGMFLPTFAWNALGHRVVTEIAYRNLTYPARLQVNKMVTDFSKVYPEFNTFNKLAPWPDTLPSQKIYTYSHWHYKDLAFRVEGMPTIDLNDTDNIVWALNLILPVVKNAEANHFERARFLAFLLHFVGDIHQPLHNVSRVSATYPKGDQGGNLFMIKFPKSKAPLVSLHTVWDQGLGKFSSNDTETQVKLLADAITQHYPEDFFGAKSLNLEPQEWNKEGYILATTFVYDTPEWEMPSNYYQRTGIAIVEQQVALAGYRLAHLLNQLLDRSGVAL